MKISLLNEKIIILQSYEEDDELGGSSTEWEEFHTCYATITKESPLEQSAAGAIWDAGKIDFTIRYSSKIKDINTKDYQIRFKGVLYTIEGIDHMSYRKKSIKIHCKKSSYN